MRSRSSFRVIHSLHGFGTQRRFEESAAERTQRILFHITKPVYNGLHKTPSWRAGLLYIPLDTHPRFRRAALAHALPGDSTPRRFNSSAIARGDQPSAYFVNISRTIRACA
jgi:hypothetical protein